MVRTKRLALVLVLVLVLVLEEDVVLFLALALAQAVVLSRLLIMYEKVVRTQGHPARRLYSRGAGGGVSNPLARQRFGGRNRGSKDTDGGACHRGA